MSTLRITALLTAAAVAFIAVFFIAGPYFVTDDRGPDDGPYTVVREPYCASRVCALSSPNDPVLVGAGDIASCLSDGDEATADLIETIDGTVFAAGDLAYEAGSETEFRDCYDPSWGRHKSRTRPVPGNHEYGTPDAAGYFDYWREVAVDGLPGVASRPYYAFDMGDWRVLMLDSECSQVGGCNDDSPQMEWLRSQIAIHPRDCMLAILHKPILTVGPHHGEDQNALFPLWQAMWDLDVDVVVAGHDHTYQRYAPLDRDLQPAEVGMRQFVVGTGGKNITDIEPDRAAQTAGLEQWSDIAGDGDGHDTGFGILKLTLHSQYYSWEFVPVEGGTYADSGNDTCSDTQSRRSVVEAE